MGERSKVYMTDLRCRPGVSLLNKLEKLMRTAGIGEINFERKLVAIKMHFGEPGNLAFLRPNYATSILSSMPSSDMKSKTLFFSSCWVIVLAPCVVLNPLTTNLTPARTIP